MMDDLQGSNSVPEVNKEEIKVASEVFENKAEKPNTPVELEKKESKMVPLHELYKERNRRKALEEDFAKFRQEHEETKQDISRLRQNQDDDDLILQAEKDLGIDKEAAKKLLNLQKKVAERSMPKQTKSEPINDPVMQAMDGFKRRAAEVSADYEDWNEMIPAMQVIMGKEIEQNGLGAYSKSPEYYYSKAIKARRESEIKAKREDAADRSNAVSMAQTESGSGSQMSSGSKINQAIFDANRKDAKWVRENEAELKQLWRQGKLK